MRTPRRKRPTELDLARLKQSADILIGLMREIAPATPEYRSLENAHDAVRTAGIDWTGNADLWRSADSSRQGLNNTGFINRPEHTKWPG